MLNETLKYFQTILEMLQESGKRIFSMEIKGRICEWHLLDACNRTPLDFSIGFVHYGFPISFLLEQRAMKIKRLYVRQTSGEKWMRESKKHLGNSKRNIFLLGKRKNEIDSRNLIQSYILVYRSSVSSELTRKQ